VDISYTGLEADVAVTGDISLTISGWLLVSFVGCAFYVFIFFLFFLSVVYSVYDSTTATATATATTTVLPER